MTQDKLKKDEPIEKIERGLGKAEEFMERHGKTCIYAVVVAAIAVAAFFGYRNWYKLPLEEEAQAQLFTAQQYFEQDSLRMALESDGSYLGMLDIAERYGSTAAGNAACFYAGIAYLHLGEYEEALRFLKQYDGKGIIGKALALGNIGDAYSELNDFDNALHYYKKAAKVDDNVMTAPRFLAKAALVLEHQGKYAEAIELYEKISSAYSASSAKDDAEKRIARLKALISQEK